MYLGQQYVNSPTLSDITFVIEGRKFFAHRIALLASSDAFRAMFEGTFREKAATEIPIPNIRYVVFERMMQCIYTGASAATSVMVPPVPPLDLAAVRDAPPLRGVNVLFRCTLS